MYRYIPSAELPKNLCSLSLGTYDGHGGHRAEHLAEMRQIAAEIVDAKIAAIVPQIQTAALQQAKDDLLRAIAFDVETVVNIAFQNGENIFRDSKTQKVVAESITQEIRKQLKRYQ